MQIVKLAQIQQAQLLQHTAHNVNLHIIFKLV